MLFKQFSRFFGVIILLSIIITTQAQENTACIEETSHQTDNFDPWIYDIKLSPNEDILAIAHTDGTYLYNLNENEITKLYSEEFENRKDTFGVTWSSDGTQLAEYKLDSSNLILINIWNIGDKQITQVLPENGDNMFYPFSISWSPDDTYIAIIGPFSRVWNVNTGEITAQPALGSRNIPDDWAYYHRLTNLIAWSPDTHYLALPEDEKIVVFDTKTWEVHQEIITGFRQIYALDWSSTNMLGIVGRGKNLEIWDVENNTQLSTTQLLKSYTFFDLSWSDDGSQLVIGNDNLFVFDIEGGKYKDFFILDDIYIRDIEWVNSQNQIILLDRNSTIRIWDIDSSCLIEEFDRTIWNNEE